MEIKILASVEAVTREGAAIIAAAARAAVAGRGRFVPAVSGGQTPWLMLRDLAGEDVSWNGVYVAQVDERVAPAGIRTETSPICARACSSKLCCVPSRSTRCRWKRPTWKLQRRDMPRRCEGSPARRRYSTSSIWV